jgi:hypothetical protein
MQTPKLKATEPDSIFCLQNMTTHTKKFSKLQQRRNSESNNTQPGKVWNNDK